MRVQILSCTPSLNLSSMIWATITNRSAHKDIVLPFLSYQTLQFAALPRTDEIKIYKIEGSVRFFIIRNIVCCTSLLNINPLSTLRNTLSTQIYINTYDSEFCNQVMISDELYSETKLLLCKLDDSSSFLNFTSRHLECAR